MIKKNIFNISIGLLFVFIILGYLFLLPKYREFNKIQDQFKQAESTLSKKEQYFKSLTDMAVRLDGYKDKMARVESALPEQISEAAVINFLEKKSSENGLVLDSASSAASQEEKKIKNAKKISFSAELSGTYTSFKNFISELYRSERMFELESASFSSSSKEAKDKLFKFKITVAVYYYSKDNPETNTDPGQAIDPDLMP